MTLERILLQTIKFDLMVEHPYAFLLKFAKLIKGLQRYRFISTPFLPLNEACYFVIACGPGGRAGKWKSR